jgi:hypothetical protein
MELDLTPSERITITRTQEEINRSIKFKKSCKNIDEYMESMSEAIQHYKDLIIEEAKNIHNKKLIRTIKKNHNKINKRRSW